MRLATLYALLLALSVSAAAQTGPYRVYASQADLDDGGTLSGALPTCLAVVGPADPSAAVLFFDRTSGQFAVHDPDSAPGARTTIVATAAALAAAAGSPVTDCRDADPLLDDRYTGVPADTTFLAVTGADGLDRVLRLDPDGTLVRLTNPASSTDAGDGVTAVVYGRAFGRPPTLFLARSQANGAPADGISSLGIDAADQTPSVVANEPGLDLVALAYNGSLIALSAELGTGDYRNAVLSVDPSTASPPVFILDRPCDGDFAIFDDCSGGLGDLVLDFVFDTDIVVATPVVMNDSPAAPRGEALAGVRSGSVLFDEAGLVANTSASGYATPARGGYLARIPADFGQPSTLLLAGSDADGATPGIYAVDGLMNVAGESAPSAASVSVDIAPNPVNATARVTVALDAPSASAQLGIYDVLGRRVDTLYDGPLAVGTHAFDFRATGLPAGLYTVRLAADRQTAARRLVVAR